MTPRRRKVGQFVTMLGTCIAATTAVVILRSWPGISRDPAPAVEAADVIATEVAAHAAYQAHLAANDTAAERWRAAHGEGRPVDSGADEPSPDTAGCPEGTQYWRRDRITELCAPLCTGDQDCGPEDGRCRILDAADNSSEIPLVLVDELPPDEVDDWMAGTDPRSPPVMVCDPFWVVEGAVDADLIDAAPVAAEE